MALNTPTGQPSDNTARDFQGASIPNVIGYRFKDLDPGANIYVQRDDQLVLQIISFSSAEVVNVNARLLQPGLPAGRTQPDTLTTDNPLGDSPFGVIVPINIMVPSGGALTQTTKVVQLAEGYLMSVAISATIATQRGQTFVRAFILRGSSNVANVAYLLASDYVTTQTAAGWPFGDVRSPLDGNGLLTDFHPANPAAGADFSILLSTPQRGELRSVSATLTTNGTVANRIVTGQIISNASGLSAGTFPANVVIPATTVARVTFAPGAAGSVASPNVINVSMPQPTRVTGVAGNAQNFFAVTTGLQAGDQWSNIEAVMEIWYDI